MDQLDIAPYLAKEEYDVISSYSTGFNRKPSFGKSPCVVVIDFTISFLGLDAPILESIKTYPKSSGSIAWSALRNTKRIIEKARSANIPIYYTIPLRTESPAGFGSKTNRENNDSDLTTVPEEIAPKSGDRVIYKHYPSGFFGTNMASMLIKDKIDSLIITGGTTSGCVRATVVDGASYHFANIIVKDAVFDRVKISNIVNLFDMRMKYADLVNTDEVLHHLESTLVVSK
jgi:maleamate amidohydrolase